MSQGAGADTTLLSIGGETQLNLGHRWCFLCPKPLAAPAPKPKSPQSKEGKGGKKSLCAHFTEGEQQDFQDCQIWGLQAGLWQGLGGLAQGLTLGWVQGAEHSSTQHRPKLHTEMHQGLLLINRHIEKNLDVSVGKSKEENEANSNKSSAHSFCPLSSCS